ncbi:MAG: hypothetical protein D3908_01610 [Candidatus Electrothrix sp. AUS4]|nr:hypothetical protein [Candidatus Electrothrix sp. AUS4]
MKNVFAKMKHAVAKKKAVIMGSGALVALGATQSHAALSPEQQAMVDAVVTAFTDLTAAVSTMGLANVGIAVSIVIVGLVVAFIFRGGRG